MFSIIYCSTFNIGRTSGIPFGVPGNSSVPFLEDESEKARKWGKRERWGRRESKTEEKSKGKYRRTRGKTKWKYQSESWPLNYLPNQYLFLVILEMTRHQNLTRYQNVSFAYLHKLYLYNIIFFCSPQNIFIIIFHSVLITTFLLPFPPSNSSMCPSVITFKLMASFFINYIECIYAFIYTYIFPNIPCWVHMLPICIFSGIIVCHQTTNLCALPWGEPSLLLPSFLSCLLFLCIANDTWAFSHAAWYVIGVVVQLLCAQQLLMLIGDTISQQSLWPSFFPPHLCNVPWVLGTGVFYRGIHWDWVYNSAYWLVVALCSCLYLLQR